MGLLSWLKRRKSNPGMSGSIPSGSGWEHELTANDVIENTGMSPEDILLAIELDEGWMRRNDEAQLKALESGNKTEHERLFKEKAERLQFANKDLNGYLKKYYSHQIYHMKLKRR